MRCQVGKGSSERVSHPRSSTPIAINCNGQRGGLHSRSCTTRPCPLSQRPKGLTKQHILNLEAFYRDKQGWKAGPHLFIDDRQIWVFTSLTVSGTHSPSWNKTALGVEMLGNFEKEAFDAGRGLRVRDNTVAALATLCAILGLEAGTIRIHREDPLTTHACPGKNVRKLEIIQAVQDLLVERHAGEHPIKPVP